MGILEGIIIEVEIIGVETEGIVEEEGIQEEKEIVDLQVRIFLRAGFLIRTRRTLVAKEASCYS